MYSIKMPEITVTFDCMECNSIYYSTELRTKHSLVAMVTTTVCNDFIAHRLEGI
jgi:transcription elongation factor Elf1